VAQARVFHLLPASPLHLGEHGIGLEETAEFAHSDTLFGALCFGWVEAHGSGALEELLGQFLTGKPPFVISSAFPRLGQIRLFPRPLLPLPVGEGAAEELKDVRWVSEGLFRRWLAGENLTAEVGPETVRGEVWVSGAEAARLPQARGEARWTAVLRPRVALHRVSSASNLYYVGGVYFAPGCGLFCLVLAEDGAAYGRVRAALEALGELGLGGERSLGFGRFAVEDAGPWEVPDGQGRFVTLSLYHPTAAEVDAGVLGPEAAYRLAVRSGWVASAAWPGRRRKWVRMLTEGSVLAGRGAGFYGDLADVTPDDRPPGAHPVYRYGYAFPVGVGLP
jgi:CRISPR-associated protein Csm4